jgi:myo-inositol-1(or 4)-monophosphatase
VRPETEAALAVAAIARDMMVRRVGADDVASKGGRDLVTATDVAVEDAVRAELTRRFPGYPVVGEERGGQDQASGDRPYWLVDPICGTRNFASDLPLYCVNVALVENGRVTLAVVGDGGSGSRYVAERGGGARLLATGNERALRTDDANVTIGIESGMAESGPHHAQTASFAHAIIKTGRWHVRMLGTTLAFAHLAAGRIAANLNFSTSSPVHTAAGCLLAEEAGAVVTDLDGRPWDLSSRSFLAAATPKLHRELLAMVAESHNR